MSNWWHVNVFSLNRCIHSSSFKLKAKYASLMSPTGNIFKIPLQTLITLRLTPLRLLLFLQYLTISVKTQTFHSNLQSCENTANFHPCFTPLSVSAYFGKPSHFGLYLCNGNVHTKHLCWWGQGLTLALNPKVWC